MATLDLEAEYNNRRRVPNHAAIQERWLKASEEFLKSASADLDKSYGSHQRHKCDLFRPRSGGGNAPLVAYIHGGYWQRGDRKGNAFVAKELVSRGIQVALPSYRLAPEASVMDIVGDLREFLKKLWDVTKQRPVVVGHSAGGHLAAAMLATDWSKAGGGVPSDLVKCAYAISGVFELEPLIPTSLNEALKLDAAQAKAASPILWSAPPKDRTFVAAAGGEESQEFIRQALAIASVWSKAGVKAECVVVPGTDHFTIVDNLANGDSAMLARVVGMTGK